MVEIGNLTKVSSHISAFEFATYQKVGRVCVIRLNFTVSTTISNSTEMLFSGGPKALANTRATLHRVNARNTDYARIGVSTDGAVANQYTSGGGISAGQYEGEIVYITAE